jgi:hypothetical protein
MELSESTKRNASEMTPAWWWPEKESLEARRPRAPLQPPALTGLADCLPINVTPN